MLARDCTAVLSAFALHVTCVHRVDAAPADSAIRNAIRQGLPRYDAKVRERFLEENARRAAASNAAVPEPPETKAENEPAVVLPRIVVRPTAEARKNVVVLPRLIVRPREKETKEDAFLTPEARDAQRVKKYLSVFDRSFLNRFTLPLFGQSKESRARLTEAVEKSAHQLNEVADLLDVAGSEERDPKEQKELQKIYLDTFYSRPR
jgi:hypothetical protein